MCRDDLLGGGELLVGDLTAAPPLHQHHDGCLRLEAFGSQRAKGVGYRLLFAGHDFDVTPVKLWQYQTYRLVAGTVEYRVLWRAHSSTTASPRGLDSLRRSAQTLGDLEERSDVIGPVLGSKREPQVRQRRFCNSPTSRRQNTCATCRTLIRTGAWHDRTWEQPPISGDPRSRASLAEVARPVSPSAVTQSGGPRRGRRSRAGFDRREATGQRAGACNEERRPAGIGYATVVEFEG